jgi:hypothetical protein
MIKKLVKQLTPVNLIGLGIILFIIHNVNQPFIHYLFLPQLGFGLILIGVIQYIMPKNKLVQLDLGSKHIWIPMLVIIASATLRLIVAPNMDTIASILFLVVMFGLYLTARHYGASLFKFLAIAVVIEAVSLVIMGWSGTRTGGLLSSSNYDIATGFLVFGAVVSISKKQWLVVMIALVGLFFTGADEAILAVGILGIAVLIREGFSKKLLITASVFATVAIIGFFAIPSLYLGTVSKVAEVLNIPELVIQAEANRYPDIVNYFFNNRIRVIQAAMSDIQPLGHGLNLTNFTFWTVHNIPLIIVDQLGITAAIAWLWTTIYCLIKTKWKYAWIAIITLGLLDHFIWTQAAPWWWVLAGVSTASTIKKDWIFKNYE